MTPEEKKAKQAEIQRRYRQSEKYKQWVAEYRKSDAYKEKMRRLAQSEKGRERKRAWNNSEAGRASKNKYNRSEKGLSTYARFRQTDHYKQWEREYRKLRRAKAKNLLPLGEYINRALLQEPIYAQASRIVPHKYPRDVRDDIIMEIVLAVLEGTHTVESASKNLSKFVPGHHRDSFKQVSMDAPVAGTDNLRIGDRIASDAFHF